MAAISIHAGHNPAGKTACGAVGLLDESKENRLIVDEVIRYSEQLRLDRLPTTTVDNGSSQNDVLNKIRWLIDQRAQRSVLHFLPLKLRTERLSGRRSHRRFRSVGKCDEQRKTGAGRADPHQHARFGLYGPWHKDQQKTQSAEQNQRAGTPVGDLLCG